MLSLFVPQQLTNELSNRWSTRTGRVVGRKNGGKPEQMIENIYPKHILLPVE